MRVAMLSQLYLPFLGGAEKQLSSVLERLPALGIEAMVIARRHDGSPVDDVVNGIPVHRIPVGTSRELASLTYTARALPVLRRFRPDVVHAHELRSPSTTAIAYRMLTGTPVVAKVLRGGSLGDVAALSRNRLGRLRLNRLLRSIDAFAVISDEIDGELAAFGVEDARRNFIPNGVDTDRYRPATAGERAAARAALGLGEGPVALFAGRLEPEKRAEQLAALWPQVRAAAPGAELLIAGTGAREAAVRRAAGEGVRVLGRHTDMPRLFAAADLFVLPSEAEGLSNAMLEAMASGLGCVATAVGAAPQLLGDRRGWLVPVDDGPALIRALTEALTDTGSGPDRRRALRRKVEENYSIDVTAARLAALYRRLARKA
ncbi:glycosyltransferase family 4 protein [Tabrizicola soli]|uniref:Glycosyltransferase family 4 protein n=1 Tax=Tabrizicola soli TaxID=2185115 RepID=A0ABV7E294_9RHOB